MNIEKEKSTIQVAGAINLLAGTLGLISEHYIYGLTVLIIGIICLSVSFLKGLDLIDNKRLLIISGIINIPFLFISSILIFIFCSNLSEYERKVNGINAPPIEENEESKKIDLLLKLGVGMVLISGILFATTSWKIIPDMLKICLLIILSIIFLGLSVFTELKLKLYKTSYIYWILGLAFLVLTIVGLQYFGIYGSFLTYGGNGSYISYFITYLLIGIFTYITYLKYNKSYLLQISFISVLISIYNILSFLTLDIITIITLISMLIFFMNIITKEDSVLNFISKLSSYIIIAYIIKFNNSEINEMSLLICSIINIINMTYLVKKYEKLEYVNLIIIFILINIGLNITNLPEIIKYICLTLYIILIEVDFFTTDEKSKNISYIVYLVLSLSCYINVFNEPFQAIVIPLVVVLLNMLSKNNVLSISKLPFENLVNPPLIFMGVLSLIGIIKEITSANITVLTMFIIISAIYTILSIITNNKKTYSSYSYILIMLSIITNIIDESLLSAIILIFINSILLATSANYEEKYLKLPIYITFLTSIFVPMSCQGLLIDNPYLTTLLFIWILVIIIITSQERTIKITSYFYIIFPILKLIYLKDLSTEVSTISTSILILYITYLIQEFLCKENSSKVLTIIIGVLVSLTIPGIFFLNKLTILIYVGLISLSLIIIGYKNNDFNKLFIFGIILTIINILVQLRDIWSSIPAWLYLLIVGLGIIIVATYLQTKSKK